MPRRASNTKIRMHSDCDVLRPCSRQPEDTTVVYCTGCQQNLPTTAFAKDRRRATGLRHRCRACSAAEFKNWQKTEGYERRLQRGKQVRATLKVLDPKSRWAEMALSNARKRAKQAGLECTLTKAWLLANCPDACPLLEVPLRYSNTKTRGDSPSIDRIDSSKGYTEDNCWVISSLANRMKNDATLAQIEMLARNLREKLALGSGFGFHPNHGIDAASAQ